MLKACTSFQAFISMHAHGGAGYDFTEGSTEAFQKASLAH